LKASGEWSNNCTSNLGQLYSAPVLCRQVRTRYPWDRKPDSSNF
jgi:hypothetical protein